MAKAWRATTIIEWGGKGADGENVTKRFTPGDIVEGPTKEEMAQLWESGALEQTEVAVAESDAPKEESAEGGDTSGSGAA